MQYPVAASFRPLSHMDQETEGFLKKKESCKELEAARRLSRGTRLSVGK